MRLAALSYVLYPNLARNSKAPPIILTMTTATRRYPSKLVFWSDVSTFTRPGFLLNLRHF
jgi:hypothetical protein